MNDEMGDRLKEYESQSTGRRLMPLLPICIRLDGRSFSKFTRNLAKPYDTRLSNIMSKTTGYMVEKTGAIIGYAQSDEISLILYSNDYKSQTFFDGRVQKLESILAAMCSVYFNREIERDSDPDFAAKAEEMPLFDCRVWNVPTREEAANTILWRERDATKNAISMAAHCYYSTNELHGKSGSEKQEMLFQKGINFNNYPPFFKRGVFWQRRTLTSAFTTEELAALPEHHHARTNPQLTFERTQVRQIDMPPFGRVINRVAVIFDGADPEVEHDKSASQLST